MELTNRIVRILYVENRGVLAADAVGRLHLLNDDLQIVRSSPVTENDHPVYALTVAGSWVVGKDRFGNIMRWSLETLDLVDFLPAAMTCDPASLMPGEQVSPIIHRGIAVWKNHVYVNNGYMQLVVLDLESFAVQKIAPSPAGDTPIEWICTDHPEVQVLSDKDGRLHIGHLDTLEFPTVLQLDQYSLHRILYDAKFNRFWVTQDGGDRELLNLNNGLIILRPDGTIEQQLKIARDDIEFVMFADGYDKVLAGGFDGKLFFIDNSQRKVQVTQIMTGFSHQISDCVMGASGQLYVLSQDGELLRIEQDGQCKRAPFRRQCVWDIQPALEDPNLLYCATDDGAITVRVGLTQRGEPHLHVARQDTSGFGFTRRIVAAPGGYAGITRDQKVFRYQGGNLLWQRALPSLPHTLSISPTHTQVTVATDDGGLVLDAATGEQIGVISIEDLPMWASTFLPTGEQVFATRQGNICAYEPGATTPKWRVDLDNYPKRMWVHQGSLFVNGGVGVRELGLDGSGQKRAFGEIMANTCENGIRIGHVLCGVTYAGQLLAYDYESGELIGMIENLPDFPKGLAVLQNASGKQILLLGGRGGYLSLVEVDRHNLERPTGALALIRTFYLPRARGQVAPKLSISEIVTV